MKPVAVVFACAVLGMAAGSLGGVSAMAAPVTPEKAAELLAHAWMIDNRCNVLGKEERDELTGFVARAEISLAEKKSVAAARAAIGKGRASGTAAACDSASARSVKDVLLAAKSATAATGMDMPGQAAASSAPEPEANVAMSDAASDGEAPDPALAPDDEAAQADAAAAAPRRVVIVTPQSVQAPAKVAIKRVPAVKRPAARKVAERKAVERKAAARKIAVIQTASASGYGRTAEAYYKELRCRTKSMRAVKAMYAQVLREHRQAVSASGKSAVRAVLRAAEARAARGSC